MTYEELHHLFLIKIPETWIVDGDLKMGREVYACCTMDELEKR